MKKAIIRIEKCVQDIQNVSSNADESAMQSEIFFSMEIEGKLLENLSVVISQPYGSNYSKEPVEVGPPKGYGGSFNHEEFSNNIERYYRSLVGESGKGISFGSGAGIRMKNNEFIFPAVFEITVSSGTEGGW